MNTMEKGLPLSEDIIRIIRSMGIDNLYDIQVKALTHALNGEDIVLSIPTASGKSLVAYLTLVKGAIEGKKGVYIVPLRALATEKYEDLKMFEPLGLRVGISTGDYDSSDAWLTRYDIIVMTAEKADALMRQRSPVIPQIRIAVVDEVHLMNEPKRGPTVEVLLSRFKEMDTQLISLSATITNAQQIADWLKARCIYDEWRPVPLREGVYISGEIRYADGGIRQLVKKSDPVCSLVVDTITDGGQALVFVRTRKISESQARALRPHISALLTESEKGALSDLAESIRKDGEENTPLSSDLASCIESGVAFHHAGLSDPHRKAVEKGFRSRVLKAVVATTTLAAGVNLPARRVILRDITRFDLDEGSSVPLPVFEVKQMCGRAGRPKYDPFGESILIARTEDEAETLMEKYLKGESEPIESKLASEPALRSHLLARISSSGTGIDLNGMKKFLGSTFYAHTGDPRVIQKNMKTVLAYLERAGLLEKKGETYIATRLGRLASDLYLDPVTVERFTLGLKEAKDTHPDIAYLHLICGAIEMPLLYPKKGMLDELYLETMRLDLLIPPPENAVMTEFYLAEVWTAKMLSSWIEEKPMETILQLYNAMPGDIASRSEIAEWLLYACSRLCEALSQDECIRSKLRDLSLRVRYGISQELIPLVRLPGIGRIRARSLHNSGIKTLSDIIETPVEKLSSVPGIGTKLAEKIKTAALAAYQG